jgi:hypothetical protein
MWPRTCVTPVNGSGSKVRAQRGDVDVGEVSVVALVQVIRMVAGVLEFEYGPSGQPLVDRHVVGPSVRRPLVAHLQEAALAGTLPKPAVPLAGENAAKLFQPTQQSPVVESVSTLTGIAERIAAHLL